MSAIPGGLDTQQGPPMTIPLRHFLVGLVFLVAGVVLGVGVVFEIVPGLGTVAHVHLLLVGWVCLTIMGAMTQFVPVWSGVGLHSGRLGNLQLLCVTVGLVGFTLAFVLVAIPWLVVFGAILLVGFWLFVYNLLRTLAAVEQYDVTEQHFLIALVFFLSVPGLGLVLAVDLFQGFLPAGGVTHGNVLGAHVTLAVFGAILTTVYGALYQLATMFTQTELHGIDHRLQSIEAVGHPTGVVLLAFGRLFESVFVARLGGLLILVAAVSIGLILGRKLTEARVEWTPMHRRYAVLAPALVGWAALSAPAWIRQPTAREHLLGAAGASHLLMLGVVGFVLVGTLYHVIPFIVWIHQYSDRLGREKVPMIDDLYYGRLAVAEFGFLLTGTVLLVISEMLLDATTVTGLGGMLVVFGAVLFTVNMFAVVYNHSPETLPRVIFGSTLGQKRDTEGTEPTPEEQ